MRKLLLLGFLFTAITSFAQEDAWVYFTDKPNAQFYLDNPLEMLSQRALDRREAQGIALDERDAPVHQPYIDQVIAAPGITVMAKSKWLNALHIRGSESNINALTNLPFVESVDFANNSLDTEGRPAPSGLQGTNSIESFIVNFNYGTSTNQIQMLNGDILHHEDFTGGGKIIAVMDNGFPGVNTTQPFERVMNNNLILGGHNFVTGTDNVFTGGTHGTKVFSTLAAFTEGSLVGTAPDASYYLFITEDTASENPVEESYWVEAAEMADSLGVDVISTSLGYFDFDNPAYNYTYDDINGQTSFMTRGADIAFTRGMVVVISAGNSGNTPNPHIEPPADGFNVLSVGAVDFEQVRGAFSSIGPTFDGRIKPDVMARGVAATFADESGNITAGNGTSFSSPIVAGLVACLWQGLPDKTNAEIMALVKGSADRFTNPDNEYGYGIPNFAWALDELSVKEVKAQNFIVYPNPAKETVTILLPEGISNAAVTVYNALGQVVLQDKVSGSIAVSIENLSKGIYSYKIASEGKVQLGKLIKE